MSYLAHRRRWFKLLRGLVAYFKLDESSGDALDSVAGNDGTVVGATQGVSGKIGNAYSFTVNDYVNIDDVLTPLVSTTEGAWCGWINMPDAAAAGQTTIVSFADTSANEFMIFSVNTGKLIVFCRVAGVIQWGLTTDNIEFSDNISYHVAFVKTTTDLILYIDAVVIDQTFTSTFDKTSFFSSATGLDNGRLGAVNFNSGGEVQFFEGVLDEIGIWDRALTADEITELYNSGAGKTYPF